MNGRIDRVEERLYRFVYWPLNKTRGRHWVLKLLALTAGWLWLLPAFVLVLAPFVMLVALPVSIWESIDD